MAAMVVLTATWLAIRFLRWQFLLRRVGVRLPTRPSLAAYLAGLPGTATPAYVGELIRGVFIRRRFGVPLRITTAVLVLERLFDAAALGILAAFTSSSGAGVAIGLSFVGVASLLAAAGKLVAVRAGIAAGALQRLFKPANLAAVALSSLAAWTAAGLLTSVGAAAVGAPLGVLDGIHVFALSTLIGAATLLPAGMGVTGSSAILQLEDLGVPLATSIVIVSLVRLTSVGVAIPLGLVFLWREWRGVVRTPPVQHFDTIAAEYRQQWSPHVWQHLLERKVDLLTAELPLPVAAGLGLDLGCGLGFQLHEMRERGYRVIGLDPSTGLLAQGRTWTGGVVAGDARCLPFRDGSFDFVYAVGVLHHLPGLGAQRRAYAEVCRVLKPGGTFLVHESNPRNPLFRFYMGYVFPVLKSIDEGTEHWVEPSQPAAPDELTLTAVRYFTFLPDFTPRFLLPPTSRIERTLERSRIRAYAAHYLAVLRRAS